MEDQIDPPVWNGDDEPKPKIIKKLPVQSNILLTNFILINDAMYSESITLRRSWKLIIDIPAFQSLKEKRYLGFCADVYSGAKASVFDHCLGTYHVAAKMLFSLKLKQKWLITDIDEYCIEVAALFANAGRCPFQKVFSKIWGADFHPQQMAVKVFEHVYSNRKIQQLLENWLKPIDILFIKELINPPKNKWGEGNTWLLTGRPKEKAFLYDIVLNKESGLDAQFLDYILRSCKTANFGISFDLNTLGRIIQSALVVTDENGPKIAFGATALRNIQDMFQGAMRLDVEVVRHKKVIAFEIELEKALKLADSYDIRGSHNERVKLRKIHTDVEAFTRLGDGIISNIINSNEKTLVDAINILEHFRWRRTMTCISRIPIKNETDEISLQTEKFRNFLKQNLDIRLHDGIHIYELQCDGNTNSSSFVGVYFKSHDVRFYDCSVTKNRSWLIYVDSYFDESTTFNIFFTVEKFAKEINVATSVLPLYKVDPLYSL